MSQLLTVLTSQCIYAFFLSFVLHSFEVSDHPQPATIFSSKFSFTAGGNEDQQIAKAETENRATGNRGPEFFLLPCKTNTVVKSLLRGHRLYPGQSRAS